MNMELSILFFLCLPVSKHPTQIDMRFPSVFLMSMISVSIILFWHVVFSSVLNGALKIKVIINISD